MDGTGALGRQSLERRRGSQRPRSGSPVGGPSPHLQNYLTHDTHARRRNTHNYRQRENGERNTGRQAGDGLWSSVEVNARSNAGERRWCVLLAGPPLRTRPRLVVSLEGLP